MIEIKAKIFKIARARDVDGPGIRTLVGISGCPLDCAYCLNQQPFTYGLEKWYTPETLLKELLKDDMYFRSTGGGITFGGGEPAWHSNFIVRFREICPPEWTLALESSFNVARRHIEALLGVIDYWYIDIKDMNPEIYKRYTRKNNTRVLENLQFLVDYWRKGEIVARVPLIRGYNTEEDRIKTLKKLAEMHIMPDLFEYTPTSRERVFFESEVLQGQLIDNKNIIPIGESFLTDEAMRDAIEDLREIGGQVSLDDNDNDWD